MTEKEYLRDMLADWSPPFDEKDWEAFVLKYQGERAKKKRRLGIIVLATAAVGLGLVVQLFFAAHPSAPLTGMASVVSEEPDAAGPVHDTGLPRLAEPPIPPSSPPPSVIVSNARQLPTLDDQTASVVPASQKVALPDPGLDTVSLELASQPASGVTALLPARGMTLHQDRPVGALTLGRRVQTSSVRGWSWRGFAAASYGIDHRDQNQPYLSLGSFGRYHFSRAVMLDAHLLYQLAFSRQTEIAHSSISYYGISKSEEQYSLRSRTAHQLHLPLRVRAVASPGLAFFAGLQTTYSFAVRGDMLRRTPTQGEEISAVWLSSAYYQNLSADVILGVEKSLFADYSLALTFRPSLLRGPRALGGMYNPNHMLFQVQFSSAWRP